MTAAAGVTRGAIMGEVYFVQSGERPLVKIGWASGEVCQRVASMQVGNPDDLVILGSVPGSLADELAWHNRFRHLAQRGEWFRLEPDLAAAILARETVAAEIWAARQPNPSPDLAERWRAMRQAERRSAAALKATACAGKLDALKVAKILIDTRSLRAVAADYGVSPMTIQAIRTRKSWSHVEPYMPRQRGWRAQ